MRLALAALFLALAVPAHGTPHATPHPKAHPKPTGPVVTLRTEIRAGNNQTAPAYAEPAKTKYVTEFPAALVVHVVNWPPEGGARRVHFRCETKNCILASTDQPDVGKFVDRVDPTSYKVQVTKGVASLRIAVESTVPFGTYVVTATPGVIHGEHAIPATFTLISR